MNKSETVVEINKAMVAFRKEVKQPLKDKNNPFFKSKYVPLENVVEAIDEAATPHGLSYTQWALNDVDGRVGVATMLMHESGEYIEYDPVFMNAEKNTPQGAGSLISYLKRYSLSAIFGITSDQDDDGNEASGKNNNPKQQTRTQWAS
ncbi:TPA: ERF family protein, partial [Staphylococcus aureus]|nr:ERF family protein [Staphylococcus aureus]HDJ2785723.1 ERF family protein [Staphylococcus aureus]HDJ2802035.1 ERF family protein [Staphylococcus aureus]HDJ2917107.1 ERF family protein [Staphylococcus aureus]HDJ3030458.1 ERF family protein [Staphylococcus aureus]